MNFFTDIMSAFNKQTIYNSKAFPKNNSETFPRNNRRFLPDEIERNAILNSGLNMFSQFLEKTQMPVNSNLPAFKVENDSQIDVTVSQDQFNNLNINSSLPRNYGMDFSPFQNQDIDFGNDGFPIPEITNCYSNNNNSNDNNSNNNSNDNNSNDNNSNNNNSNNNNSNNEISQKEDLIVIDSISHEDALKDPNYYTKPIKLTDNMLYDLVQCLNLGDVVCLHLKNKIINTYHKCTPNITNVESYLNSRRVILVNADYNPNVADEDDGWHQHLVNQQGVKICECQVSRFVTHNPSLIPYSYNLKVPFYIFDKNNKTIQLVSELNPKNL